MVHDKFLFSFGYLFIRQEIHLRYFSFFYDIYSKGNSFTKYLIFDDIYLCLILLFNRKLSWCITMIFLNCWLQRF
ncbi:unnamed protein product [Rotaria magnacalcarata]|uniref:Uncharacterized protein n=1 Tax=Rotaria magnacalcarata TaxID=392030 RepID=A0A816TDE5_9BILA|nr:unnamed protein product [Rotaria magnacalcarata]